MGKVTNFHEIQNILGGRVGCFVWLGLSDQKNYRPILLLPVASKIIQETIHIETQNYLDKNGLLYRYQSVSQVFAQIFLTDSCLVQLTDFILREMDKRFHTGMILFEITKNIEHVKSQLLLQKMKCIGFKESVIQWFQSYLPNKKLFVTLENVFSDSRLINCGVPKGSILGRSSSCYI